MGFIDIKNFALQMTLLRQWKGKPQKYICKTCIWPRTWIQNIYIKKLLQLNHKRKTAPFLKNGQRIRTDISSKKIHRWQVSPGKHHWSSGMYMLAPQRIPPVVVEGLKRKAWPHPALVRTDQGAAGTPATTAGKAGWRGHYGKQLGSSWRLNHKHPQQVYLQVFQKHKNKTNKNPRKQMSI